MSTGILLGTLAAVGAATSAAGSIAEGQATKKASRVQSDILKQQAQRERQQSKVDADQFRRRQSRLLASQRAGFGASGVSLTGTPLAVGADLAAEIELQAQQILSGGEAEATSLENEAGLARFRGNQASTAGFFGAGASLLSGAARAGRFFEEDRPKVPGDAT